MSALAAHGRRALWTTVLHLNGGLDVRGALPVGGCVVVANHSSHADAPSVIAAIDAAHQPLVAAAADYWFESRAKSWFCRSLVGGFPVHRTGGGYRDLAATEAALRAGRAVIVFPAGSRKSVDGRFHEGAFRLAHDAQVPVVPVRIGGSSQVLTAGHLPRRGKIVVDIAPAHAVEDPSRSTRDVQDLLQRRPEPRTERDTLRSRVAAFTSSPVGLLSIAVWAFAEAIFWPVITELLIAALVLSGPLHPARRGMFLAAAGAVGSAVGGVATLLLVRHGVTPPAPLTSSPMFTHAQNELRNGLSGLWSQPMSGIPYKVYAHVAGATGIGTLGWFAMSVQVRFARMAAVAVIAALAQRLTRSWSHLYTRALAAGLLVFVVSLCLVSSAWSRH